MTGNKATIDHASAEMLGEELGRKLAETGLLDELALERARRAAVEGKIRLDHALLELGLIEEDRLLAFVGTWLDLPLLKLEDFDAAPVPELAAKGAFLRRMAIAPVRMSEEGLLLAMADPFNPELAKTIAFDLDLPVHRALAPRRTIMEILNRDYPDQDATKAAATAETDDVERLRSLANEGPVIRLVNDIVSAAVEIGASDIHLEAQETEMQVRFRVDGTLRPHRLISGEDRNATVSRLKVMANLNISERRRPQDGRLRVAVRGRNVDFRMSTLPTQFGESIVLRILDRSRLALDWQDLGFAPEMAARVEHLTGCPHGLFLVTGPTGSGKTTTLYTALSKLDAARQKIFTVEDPIEYTLKGINQIQVRPELDMTFAAALRGILRQDPDVVMVGEIRDAETAENAVRAALMGRMVLSTVHTNSALGAVDRLTDLGVPPFLLAATLRGVLSQRLVRRVCPSCKRPDPTLWARLPDDLKSQLPPDAHVVTAPGCPDCAGLGYQGRVVLAELFEVDQQAAEVIGKGGTGQELDQIAKANGMLSLAEEGMKMAGEGILNLEDLFNHGKPLQSSKVNHPNYAVVSPFNESDPMRHDIKVYKRNK